MSDRTSVTTVDEEARLQALNDYRVMDTGPEQAYDDLTSLAAFICGTPVSLVSLVGRDKQFFKSAHGFDATETSRDVSFCAHTIGTASTLVVEDAQLDPRFADNVLVKGDPHIRFYAGAPILTRDGHVLGTVCVIDAQPRHLTPAQVNALEALARQATELLELRRRNRQLEDSSAELDAAEISAKEDRARLLIALQGSDAFTFDWLPEDDIIRWSGMPPFGRPAEEIRAAADAFRLVHPEDIRKLRTAIASATADGETYSVEFRAYWPDGQLRWVQTTGRVMHLDASRPRRIVGVNTDITSRKLAEDALVHAEKLAAVGRLASVISHEINNPLEAVTNLLYIVRSSQSLTVEDRGFLELADKELARVSQITAQTLRFHRSPQVATPVEATEMIEDTLLLYRTRLQSSNIDVQLKMAETAGLHAHVGDVRQVLNNLIGNAFDAMRTGGTLYLRARCATDWRTMRGGVSITVADTGAGVPAEHRARLFEAFYSTKGMNGTGLGLWISRRIVQKHGGRLTFRSRSGDKHGTVFRLWLPLEAAASAGEAWL